MTWEDPNWSVEIFLPDENKWRWAANFDPSDGVLFCKRQPRHLHKLLNSWGISAYVIEMLETHGLKKIVVFVEGTREVFETTLENAKTEAVYKFWKDQGYDRQLFLALPLWTKKK